MSRARFRNLPCAVALASLLGGCALHINRDPPTPDTFVYAAPSAPFEPFLHPAGAAPQMRLSEPIDRTRSHDIVEFSYASAADDGGEPNVVRGRYFRSRAPGRKKLVVVMPIWGTSSYPPQKVSYGYARRAGDDANVIWIYGDTPLFPWTELSTAPSEAEFVTLARASAERYRGAVVDMRRLIDWAETQPEIDGSRVAFVGFSMSALVTATLLGNDARVKAAVLMMGAANLADIFSTCRNRAGEVRAHVLDSFGWSIDRYRQFFAELFGPADPLRFTGRYNPDEILMIDAMFDDCMPGSAREALWEVTGFPQRVTLLYQHRTAFYSLTPLGVNFARRRIYRFLDDAL